MALHIVVIDDDFALQEFYRLLLEGEGYRVTIFSSLDPSPDSIAELQPDLVILDLLLGGQQLGWSFLQALASQPQTATLPVLLVTALPLASFEKKWQIFTQRANFQIVMKPFDIDSFLATISSFLSAPPPSLA